VLAPGDCSSELQSAATDELLQSGVLEDVGGDPDDIQHLMKQARTRRWTRS